MTASIKTEQQFIQEAFILVTGRMATRAEITGFQALIQNGNYQQLDALIDQYMNGITPAVGGVQKMVQAIAKNGLGMTIADADAPAIVEHLGSLGINSWSKLLHWLSDAQGGFGDTLSNRGAAANGFLDTLQAAGKTSYFTGEGVTAAAKHLLQNITHTVSSYQAAQADLAALANNLGAGGIRSLVVDGYVAGATVFIDADGDGQKDAGEWSTTTDATGAYVFPGNAAVGGVVAFGGTDLMTGQAFKGVLTAPAGSTVVNPLTTLVQTLLTQNEGVTLADITTKVQSALSLPEGVNILSYDPLAVLSSSTASDAAKAKALATQSVALQVANIITQVSGSIDAASTSSNLLDASSAVTRALANAITQAGASPAGTFNLSSPTAIAQIVQTAAASTGGTMAGAQASQIALVTSASNNAASKAGTIAELAKVAVVSQGAATQALVTGISSGSLTAAVQGFSGNALDTAISTARPEVIAPGVPVVVPPAPAPAPPLDVGGGDSSPQYTSRSGSAADLAAALAGITGLMDTVTITGANPTVEQLNTIAGATTGVVTASISGTAAALRAGLANLTASDAITITLDAGAAAATDLTALDGKTSVAVNATAITGITGSAAQVAAVIGAHTASPSTISIDGDYTVEITGTDAATLAQLVAINNDTSGTITLNAATQAANWSGTAADLAAAFNGITGVTGTVTISDVNTTPVAATALSAIGGSTSGTVTVTHAVAISGTTADVMAAMVSDATKVIASTATVTITGANPTIEQLNTIALKTDGVVTASISGTAADLIAGLGNLTGADAITVTVTDAVTISQFNTLNNRTSVNLVLQGGIRDTANNLAPGVTASAGYAAATSQDGDVAVTITSDNPPVAQVNTIAALTTGVVTANMYGEFAASMFSTLAETGNAYTINLDDTDGNNSPLQATALSALAGKTTVTVTVQNAITITGTSAELMAALVPPNTRVLADNANVSFNDVPTISQYTSINAVVGAVTNITDNLSAIEAFINDNPDFLQTYTGVITANGSANPDTVDFSGVLKGMTIHGLAGADSLRGTRFADVISGGIGEDTFVFAAGDAPTSGVGSGTYDRIDDFAIAEDKIDLLVAPVLGGVNETDNTVTIGGDAGTVNIDALGKVTFTGNEVLDLTLSEALTAVRLLVTGAGEVAFFEFGGGTFLYQENGAADNDILVFLMGTTGVVDTSGVAGDSNTLWLV